MNVYKCVCVYLFKTDTVARSELSETGSMPLGSLALMKAPSLASCVCVCVFYSYSRGLDTVGIVAAVLSCTTAWCLNAMVLGTVSEGTTSSTAVSA